MVAPLGHLTERWRKHALNGDEIAPNYYEAAAFESLKGRVRSGDIAVGGSRRYRAFEGYLLPQAHFEQLAQKGQTRLAVTNEAEAYLETMQREITEKLVALKESIGKVEGSLRLDEKGQLHLPPLEKEIPAEVDRLRPRVYSLLPQIKLPDLLLELDNWTGFLRPFTHLTSGDAPVGEEKLALVAALMGMNLGLTKMEQSCPYSYRQLSWSVDWHIREETLLAALACLDNFVLSAPLSRSWGDGTTSSSDGMRMSVGVKAANAENNAKYFGAGRGTNIYAHAADIWVPFGKPQVIGTNKEALYVIDALCHHESDLHIREHYADTGGSTEHVFALAALLGFRFAPRISDALSKKLYLPGEVGESGPLETLAFGQVNRKLISEQWDEMRSVASSIRHGTVSASPACAQTGCLPAPKSGRAGADGGRQARTNGFLAGVFSR